jgi:hypothetical protein
MTFRSIRAALFCSLAATGFWGCELQEVTVVDVEAVVIAEVYANLADDPTDNVVRAFLHWTVGLSDRPFNDLAASTVVVTRSDGLMLRLGAELPEDCIESTPEVDPGACFLSGPTADQLRPGDLLEVSVTLPGGGVIEGAARVPGDFDLIGITASCRLAPDRLLPIEWSRAETAWAYVNETSIKGLPDALRGEGIIVEDDPLYLLGLSISDDDTDIVFPSEFGVFNRFDLDQSLAVRLQRGLPATSWAEVSITAVDRNYVNWARGGNFNPSGQVRVPSLRGDGTGVFGATVGRRFNVFATSDPQSALPVCPTP